MTSFEEQVNKYNDNYASVIHPDVIDIAKKFDQHYSSKKIDLIKSSSNPHY